MYRSMDRLQDQKGDVENGYQNGTDSAFATADLRKNFQPSVVLHLFTVAVKVGVIIGLIAAIIFVVWYFMGWMFLIELFLVAIVAFIAAGGGYQFIYLVYKTGFRDLTALQRYLRFLWCVRRFSKNNLTIAAIFREHALQHPDKIAFIFEGTEWTQKQVEEYSNRVANVFRSHGLCKGDTVALMMENRPEFVCLWLGLSKLGVITPLINCNLRHSSLLHSINIANCQAFIFGADLTDAVKDVSSSLGSMQLYSWGLEESPSIVAYHEAGAPIPETTALGELEASKLGPLISKAPSTPPELAADEQPGFHDRLIYVYTSGTTGLPKAAVITNARYVFLAGAIAYQVGFRSSDRFYTPLPLYHTAGGAMCVGQALVFGSTVVIRKKFSASGYFQDVVKYKCTIGQYIGEMCRYLLSTPPKPEDSHHQLRMMFGNGLRPQIWKQFVTRFNIPCVGEFYGATEGNANIANMDNTFGAIGFVSRILPSVYPISIIRVDPHTGEPIRNEKGLCITCKADEPGVFIGKITPNNPARAFLGYVNKKESEKKVVFDVFAKGDSAFLSGDILVADEWGYLYFKDRTGDTFRWKGENVSTSEVEGIVSNLADYRDCVVYGVEVFGTDGRAGMAAIVDNKNGLDLNKLAEGLKKALPSYARPLFIRALKEVEITGTFKLKKLDLQKEGFNPSGIKDKLYYMVSGGSYEPLTQDVYEQIGAGKIRF